MNQLDSNSQMRERLTLVRPVEGQRLRCHRGRRRGRPHLHACTRARYGVLYFDTEMSAHKHGVCFNDDRCTLPEHWTRML
jgi:hypothetical protein